MTIQECYRQMGANYEDVLKRLYNEGMICRFTLMFLNDDSYPKLEQALKEGNVKEAFRAAHTLKGVCQNLGFTNLYQPTYDLTEVLRTGTLEGTKELFDPPVQNHHQCDPCAPVSSAFGSISKRHPSL
jgi:HPt (histidine-containing phosphotransfer) domain-containing protein